MDDRGRPGPGSASLPVMGTPLLRPGARLLRRDADHLQLGLDPAHALVVTDTPEHRGLLTAWQRGDLRELLHDHPLGRRLRAAGLVVGSARQSGAPGRRAGDRYAGAARLLRPTEDPAGPAPRVRLESYGGEPGALLARRVARLLTEAGTAPAAEAGPDPDAPAAVVLVGVGQPARDHLDPWLRAGTTHLLLRVDEGVATVGPFVVPARTACLRCLDAHHAEDDPRWPLLVEQHARLAGTDRPDGVPEPLDPALAALAAAWVVRDVLAWRAGLRPSTWSTTLRIAPDTAGWEARAWPRHPGCGCGWDLSATMAG